MRRSDAARRRWEARTDMPLLVAALLFVAAYAWPVLDAGLEEGWRTICSLVILATWALFAVDLAVRLWLAERRGQFLRANWFDIPVLLLPMFRPLVGLRAVVALNVLARRGGSLVRGRVVASVIAAVGLVGFVAAVAMLEAERGNPDANIANFGDASWWAVTTATTVGYGERFPTTVEGRLVAVGLMVTGIALVGVGTAALASWFVERVSEAREADDRTEERLAELLAEVRALRAELDGRRD